MSYYITDILTTLPQTFVAGFVTGKYIQAKNNRFFTLFYTVTMMLIYVFLGNVLHFPYWARGGLTLISQFVLIALFRNISLSHSFGFQIFALCLMFCTELPLDMVIFHVVPGFTSIVELPLSLLITIKVMYLPLVVLSFIIPYWCCNRFFKTASNSEVSRYIPFFILQAFLILLPITMELAIAYDYVYITVLSIIILLANVLLDLLLMRTFDKISRTHELELQNKQAQSVLQAQISYYQQLQDSTAAMRQVRHDMKNQLQTLAILLDEEDLNAARQQLSAYREQLKNTETDHFTGNTVLDAVISAKADLCRQKDISITCTGSVPNDISVDAVHLCSIAANLLDNAIHACEALPPDIVPAIEFSAHQKDGKLIFVSKNPAVPGRTFTPTPPKLNQEHGWGLSILSRIAQDYGGEVSLEEQEGIVHALLWLIPKSPI